MIDHYFHGINVSDGGERTLGPLRDAREAAGNWVTLHDLGYLDPIRLRFQTRRHLERLAEVIKDGCVLVGHSHGALFAHHLCDLGIRPAAVVVIQPAMRRDAEWPRGVPVLCLWNPNDLAVAFARPWSRLTTAKHYTLSKLPIVRRVVPEFRPHGWGSAGRNGFNKPNPNMTQWDTAAPHWRHAVRGHSNFARQPAADVWARRISNWIEDFKK